MVTAKDALNAFGAPELESHMTVLVLSSEDSLLMPTVPKKIYCNIALSAHLYIAFKLIIKRGLTNKIKTWDGCFNIRKKRGATSASLHSWGLAIDINAAGNQFGKTPTMDLDLVQCFKDAGFDWGGDWAKPDGMHFQVSKLGL